KPNKSHALVEGKSRLGRIGVEIVKAHRRAVAYRRDQRPPDPIPSSHLRHIKMAHPACTRIGIVRVNIPPANADESIARPGAKNSLTGMGKAIGPIGPILGKSQKHAMPFALAFSQESGKAGRTRFECGQPDHQVLNLNSITSPSLTTYSLP